MSTQSTNPADGEALRLQMLRIAWQLAQVYGPDIWPLRVTISAGPDQDIGLSFTARRPAEVPPAEVRPSDVLLAAIAVKLGVSVEELALRIVSENLPEFEHLAEVLR